MCYLNGDLKSKLLAEEILVHFEKSAVHTQWADCANLDTFHRVFDASGTRYYVC